MKAVVMAGGEGTRLRPLTSNRPKPLVPVLNKPIAQHIIEHLRRAGITDIVVTLYYLAEEIQTYFGDGSDMGVNLIYSVEDTPLGTAGSVKKAEQYLNDDTFVIVSGDALTDFNIEKAVGFHRAKKSEATLILQQIDNPLDFGVVMTEEGGRIARFLEKPSWGEVFSDTVNTGMYILEPSVFALMEPNKNYDWSQDIFPRMLASRARTVRLCDGRILDGCWFARAVPAGAVRYAERPDETIPSSGRVQNGNIYIGAGTELDADVTSERPTNYRDKLPYQVGFRHQAGYGDRRQRHYRGRSVSGKGHSLGFRVCRQRFQYHRLHDLPSLHHQRQSGSHGRRSRR